MSKVNESLVYDSKNLYNLGAYDTLVDNGDGTVTITRQTGYLDWENFKNLPRHGNQVGNKYLNLDIPLPSDSLSNITSNAKQVGKWNWWSSTFNEVTVTYDDSTLNIIVMLIGSSGTVSDTVDLKIQYKLISPYTEKIIKNRPLDTLPQTGSQWVRNEWDKTTNLFEDSVTGKNIGVSGEFVNDSTFSIYFAKIEAGQTYCTNTESIVVGFYDFKPTGDTTYERTYDRARHFDNPFVAPITGWVGVRFMASSTTAMINKGSINLPYQPYSGELIHKADIEPVLLWQNSSPTSDMSAGTTISIPVSSFKYIIIGTRFTTNSALASIRYDKFKPITTGTISIFYIDSGGHRYQRNFILHNSDISVGDGTMDGAAGQINVVIPVEIYGTNIL